ncbi:Ribonuclease H-like superfamily protein [Gossypium australe]|uniref:Ribonuclease H-like superfamily protein n=1 Tax=Gossypium australe TaxID=47621 RepID=A0A5B6UCD5_9ROSI|nr:Ribonuclease H-like superfamily protein [Gossypium australe]
MAKYFLNDQFLNSRLGNSSSYTWKSIWAVKDVLTKGLCWRVGTGINISINDDAWVPDAINFRLSSVVNSMRDLKVNALIDNTERIWKMELIKNTFSEEDAGKILRIPLARAPHDDFLVWGGEASGEFSVCSAYKLLQISDENPRAYALQTIYRKFYKKLWLLNLLTKIKITIWRFSWNYLPTKYRKLATNSSCPRCGERAETINHLFRECPVTVEVWTMLSLQNILIAANMDFVQWLTWVFEQLTPQLDGLENRKLVNTRENRSWSCLPREFIKINFDGAYDGKNNFSASGIVVRNEEGLVILSCSETHQGVASAFAAEAVVCRKAVRVGFENK